ncbi:MAG: 50S ribosomal protein L4 [Deltaproteobacteria bacterium]
MSEKRKKTTGAAAPIRTTMRSMSGSQVGEIDLPGSFGERRRNHLIYEVVQSQLASRRAGTHATKTRAMVSGGGKKPWKQKGTGRARAGSSRSPLWAGGATVFGPQPRDYSYRLPAQARRTALRSAIADRQREGALQVLDRIALPEAKTKRLVEMLGALGLEKSVLIVIAGRDDSLERAARNLPGVKVLRSEGLNVADVLRHKTLVLTQDAVAALAERVAS